jgi:hypothetical protein
MTPLATVAEYGFSTSLRFLECRATRGEVRIHALERENTGTNSFTGASFGAGYRSPRAMPERGKAQRADRSFQLARRQARECQCRQRTDRCGKEHEHADVAPLAVQHAFCKRRRRGQDGLPSSGEGPVA